GGLAVALAECAMQGGLGAAIALDSKVRPSALLFSESTGRAVISSAPEGEEAVRAAAQMRGVPFMALGRVGGDRLTISVGRMTLVDEPVAALAVLWRTAFAHALESAEVL